MKANVIKKGLHIWKIWYYVILFNTTYLIIISLGLEKFQTL